LNFPGRCEPSLFSVKLDIQTPTCHADRGFLVNRKLRYAISLTHIPQ
jgi:hypothetical protein